VRSIDVIGSRWRPASLPGEPYQRDRLQRPVKGEGGRPFVCSGGPYCGFRAYRGHTPSPPAAQQGRTGPPARSLCCVGGCGESRQPGPPRPVPAARTRAWECRTGPGGRTCPRRRMEEPGAASTPAAAPSPTPSAGPRTSSRRTSPEHGDGCGEVGPPPQPGGDEGPAPPEPLADLSDADKVVDLDVPPHQTDG